MASNQRTGFVHSVPVPRIYKVASKIAQKFKDGKSSLKNLVFAERHASIPTIYALIMETLKRNELIDGLIEKSKLLVDEPRFNIWLAKILICELLWGKNKIQRGSKPVEIIFKYEETLRKSLESCEDSIRPIMNYDVVKPRYVRVNTIEVTMEEAVNNFREEGWTFIPYFKTSDYEGFLNHLTNLKSDEFMKDIHIPDLLIFPPKTKFHQHKAYKSGHLILQDKASCLPVHLLAPQPGSVVLDMCAAPGMKTSQIAALMKNEGKVYAVEMNTKRELVLKKRLESAKASCVETINKDVMLMTADDCPEVEYILVDPSCSGSGITHRIELKKVDEKKKALRLKKLCGFQAKLLRHSMDAFPKAKRIVYSTCSVNSEENEGVVKEILETSTKFKLVDAKKLLPSWNTKTSELYPELGNMCIYATPEEDKTHGFFVAVFERLEEGEKNPYLNFELCEFFNKKLKKNINSDNFLEENGAHESRKQKKYKRSRERRQGYLVGKSNLKKKIAKQMEETVSNELNSEEQTSVKSKKKKRNSNIESNFVEKNGSQLEQVGSTIEVSSELVNHEQSQTKKSTKKRKNSEKMDLASSEHTDSTPKKENKRRKYEDKNDEVDEKSKVKVKKSKNGEQLNTNVSDMEQEPITKSKKQTKSSCNYVKQVEIDNNDLIKDKVCEEKKKKSKKGKNSSD